MAKPNQSSPEAQEIIAGQNEFNSRLPKDFTKRVTLLDNLKATREKLNDKIAQAKKDLGISEIERTLTEQNGYTPQTLKIVAILDGMPARSRAATIRQVNLRAEDKLWILPDMFDAGSTSTRQGESAAQQRSPEEMAASHENGDEEGDEGDEETLITSAEARKELEAYLVEHPRSRGTKPKELKRLDAQLAEALAREGSKPDNVVNLGGQMRGTAEAGEAHIKEQLKRDEAKDSAKATAEQPAAADPAPEAKAKRAPRKKAEPATEAKKDGPPLDDDSEEEAPAAPPPPGGPIGSVPSSFKMA